MPAGEEVAGGPGACRSRLEEGAVTDAQEGSLHFEDVVEGRLYRSGARRVGEAEIVRFAREWDPQPFHLDGAAAESSLFGTLVASGLHTLMVTFSLYNEIGLFRTTALAGTGIDKLRWLAPVYPDDVLQVDVTTAAKRSVRNPERGLVTLGLCTKDEAGRVVLNLDISILVARRRPSTPPR